MFSPIVEWFDFAKGLSLAAFGVSLFSLYFSGVRSQLAKAQEKRRTPNLVLSSIYGQFQDGQGRKGRLYAFNLLVKNRADNSNSIAKASLSITFLTENRLQMKMIFLAIETPEQELLMPNERALPVPIEIDAHNSVAGWIYFHVPAEMLKGNIIEKYVISLTDTHDQIFLLEETFLQEVRNAEA